MVSKWNGMACGTGTLCGIWEKGNKHTNPPPQFSDHCVTLTILVSFLVPICRPVCRQLCRHPRVRALAGKPPGRCRLRLILFLERIAKHGRHSDGRGRLGIRVRSALGYFPLRDSRRVFVTWGTADFVRPC